MHEMYLLGHRKCLRHGRDMAALDYEASSIVLGVDWGAVPWSAAMRPSMAGMTDRDREAGEPIRKRVSTW